MATFLTHDEEPSRAFLSLVGVRILRVDDPDAAEVMRDVLGDSTQERGRIVADPPADAAASDEGMGAWHINACNEFETVVSGEGILEFMTDKGPVAVLLSAGDIMAVERAEHRYRPVTPQEWVLRFAADDLGAVDTGRESGPWPHLPV
ncbi:MAG: hypothetical protein GC156_06365 [Actinomycetales bacterium]|nr:hypothetical protein [Actinomycetales bacterium]